jgi:hypothetical protein
MQLPAKKPPFFKRQIPTLLGLAILVISLIAGVLLFSGGTGVFAPRATPETTPKNVKVTNLTDKSFTISFYTAENTAGFIKYGTEERALRSQAGDDRDQLSGSTGQYQLHHVTVRGLTADSAYYYVLGTGSGTQFDNDGVPFVIKTFPTLSTAPPVNKTIYGTVVTDAGSPAEGSIVYVTGEGVAEMSSLVKSSGSWAIALSSARTTNGAEFAALTDETNLNVIIQGVDPSKVSVFSTPIADAQPIPEITLGQIPEPKPVVEEPVETDAATTGSATGGSLDDLLSQIGDDAEQSALSETGDATASTVLNLETVSETETPVLVAEPIINGTAAPGVTVTIEVHSDAQITQTLVADADGGFSLNLAALGQQLDPGEHTVTYSYADPTTGETVTRTQTFVVADTSSQLALADTSTQFGSGNPFPVTSPTPTPAQEETTRSAVVATDSGTFQAGSMTNTIALIAGGTFFITAGAWSWWLAREVRQA